MLIENIYNEVSATPIIPGRVYIPLELGGEIESESCDF